MEGSRPDLLTEALGRLGVEADACSPPSGRACSCSTAAPSRSRILCLRAAADAAMGGEERRDVHRALAAVAPEGALRAWHLANAATGPDEALAAELERSAVDARAKGAPDEAVRAWERAAQLSEDADRRAQAAPLRPRATRCRPATPSGRSRTSPRSSATPASIPGRARRRGRLAGVGHDALRAPADGIALLDAEAEALGASDPVAGGADHAADHRRPPGHRRHEGRRRDGPPRAHARRRRPAHDLDGATSSRARGSCPRATASRAWRSSSRGFPALDLVLDDATVVSMVAFAGSGPSATTAARALLDDLVFEARSAGAIPRLIFPLAARADLERRRGRWRTALADATEAIRLGRDAGIYAHMSFALATTARLAGAMGDLADARRDAAEAHAMTGPAGAAGLAVHPLGALGLAELSAGDPAAALVPLRAAAELYRSHGWGEPCYPAFHGDLVEALVATGETAEAESVLDGLDTDSRRTTTQWPRAVAARGRGLLAPEGEFDAHFERALDLVARAEQPFERARTELLYGERLRRAGRIGEATDRLRSAAARFEQLGARPWGDRARRELSGGTVAARPAEAAETFSLTAQEWRVALLVAQGMTNREAGAALFVSPKTVEHMLTQIYKKVGVRSRTQLAKRVATEDARQVED
jgi:DNA-binding CsgD family transcriptional regulator